MSSNAVKTPKIFDAKKRKTYLRMLRSVIVATLCIIIALIVLQLFGINVSSMLAGVGIVSIVVGFALQDALKDIIRGIYSWHQGLSSLLRLDHFLAVEVKVAHFDFFYLRVFVGIIIVLPSRWRTPTGVDG